MISIERVTKRFGRVTALSDVSLSIREGESVAFVGTNGSGKTTLVRSMLGLVRFEGRIAIAGTDVARSPEIALRKVAYVPQVSPPIEAPVREVVRAVAELRAIRPHAIYEKAALLSLDLTALEKKRFRDLSGGMKQKLLAAMALAADTSILACDEPTANLDAEARETLFHELHAHAGKRTLVLCSHRVEEVERLVDRVLQFEDGRVTPTRGQAAGSAQPAGRSGIQEGPRPVLEAKVTSR